MLAASTGCDQINARRNVQDGNKLYEKGEFKKAALAFEEALKTAPDLAIAWHNLGLAYYKLFKPGDETPENKKFAAAATDAFSKYLQTNPDDRAIIDLVTRIWMDSGDYQKAIAYWEGELSKAPDNVEIMALLAGIERQSGNWEGAVKWHRREAETHKDPAAKANALMNIAKLALNKLINREKIVGEERLKLADIATAALLEAAQLTPETLEIKAYLRSAYEKRSMAHGATWAAAIDNASSTVYARQWAELNKKQNPVPGQQTPAPATTNAPGAPPAAGSPSAEGAEKRGG
jgi:tetratricopeptide (TPR) repeat protein